MLRISFAAMLIMGAAGMTGCASTYDGYGPGYAADLRPGYYDYPGYNQVVVPRAYPYTYPRHVYSPRHGHPGWDHHHDWDHRGWNANSLRNPAWPRGNYGPGHGAYRGPDQPPKSPWSLSTDR